MLGNCSLQGVAEHGRLVAEVYQVVVAGLEEAGALVLGAVEPQRDVFQVFHRLKVAQQGGKRRMGGLRESRQIVAVVAQVEEGQAGGHHGGGRAGEWAARGP